MKMEQTINLISIAELDKMSREEEERYRKEQARNKAKLKTSAICMQFGMTPKRAEKIIKEALLEAMG